MKRFNYYLSLMLLLVFTAACSDEFDQPPMVVPQASRTANITIADFKAKYWQDGKNFIDTIKEDEVIHGWITSSDEAGNVYKQIYISDGTAGLTISIDQSSLYNKYRLGQEVVIPMKDYFIGKFNGLYCLGVPYLWEEQNVWESNRMSLAQWEEMVELNGFPDLSKVDTTLIELSEIKDTSDPAVLLKYMSRLVRINGVSFEEGGEVFAEVNDNNKNTVRNIVDDDGNSLKVSNSQYATFRADTLPEGIVDVVGELSYTSSDGFFLILRQASDVITKTSGGTKRKPFTIDEAITGLKQGNAMNGWYGGYAVGAVAPEVTTVTSNNDIEWGAPTTLDNTILLADDPECKDFTKCMIVLLPQGSLIRTELNLRDNANVYKAYVKVNSQPVFYMGMTGITDPKGYDAVVPRIRLEEGFDSGIPDGWSNLAVSGTAKWSVYSYTSAGNPISCAQIRPSNSIAAPVENWLITPALDLKNSWSKILSFNSEVNNVGDIRLEVYILNSSDPTTATVKEKLNPILPAKPTGTRTYSDWTSSGEIDLSKWADGEYYIGFRYYAATSGNYTTWCIDNVTFGLGDPPAPVIENRADFETMGDASGKISSFTSEKGWQANNSYLFEGGETDNNPVFKFIGFMTGSDTHYAKAPALNGNKNQVGTIVSPVLKNGIKKLAFSYGAPYSDKNLSLRIDVKQNGNVVKSWTETRTDAVRYTVYNFEQTCDVKGDFTIEITNLCPSNATTNKDRVAIWNLVWDSNK